MIKIPKFNSKQLGLLGGAAALMIVGIVLLVLALHPPKAATPKAKKAAPIAVVEIDQSGFVPASLHVTKGTKVVWVNKDVAPHQIAADPYPTHTSLPALFAPKAMGQNQTYSFVFTKARTISYHDDLNPTWEGTIEVQ